VGGGPVTALHGAGGFIGQPRPLELFNPKTVEGDDLYDYLVGNFGARAEHDVSHVGGCRVELRLKFAEFAFVSR
jgi:hypothetical protein